MPEFNAIDWSKPITFELFKKLDFVFDYEAETLTITPHDMEAKIVLKLNAVRGDYTHENP